MNRHLSLLFAWASLWCGITNTFAQTKQEPCRINYEQLLMEAKNGDYNNIEKQLINKKLIVEKRRNQIFRKFGTDKQSSVYYDSQLEITVKNVQYQDGRLLLQYSPTFALIVDDFADFALYENSCRPKKGRGGAMKTLRPSTNSLAVVSYRKSPTTIYNPEPGILKRTYHYPNSSTTTGPLTQLTHKRSSEVGLSTTYRQASPLVSKRSSIVSKQYTRPATTAHTVKSVSRASITKAKASAKPLRKKRANRNLAELFWGAPIEGDFIKGCANGKCTFDPNGAYPTTTVSTSTPSTTTSRKHFGSSNYQQTDILINKEVSAETGLNCKNGVCVKPATEDNFGGTNIFGKQCTGVLSDGSRCSNITQWKDCGDH